MSNECRHARLAIGGEPHDLSPEVSAHLATCAACRQFHARDAVDGRPRARRARAAADEIPQSRHRRRHAASRWRHRWCSPYSSAAGSGCCGRSLRSPGMCSSTSSTKLVVGEHRKCCPRRRSPMCCRRPACSSIPRCPWSMPRPVRFTDAACRTWSCRPTNGPMTVMLLAHEKVASAPGVLRRRLSRRLAAGGRGQRRGADAERRSAGRGRDAGGQRGSLVASTSQPDCAPPSSVRSSGSHSRISSSTR